MIARDLINHSVPHLSTEDHVSKAHQLMDDFQLSEMPVVANGQFLGFVRQELLFDDHLNSSQVGDYPMTGADCVADVSSHYYEVLSKAVEYSYKIVAIINQDGIYQGVILTQDIIDVFAKSFLVTNPGAILELKLRSNDYSLTEISRIVESNEGKILSSHLSAHPKTPEDYLLTLKVNIEDITYLNVSLEQNGFMVENFFGSVENEFIEKDRIDMLMKYLKI